MGVPGPMHSGGVLEIKKFEKHRLSELCLLQQYITIGLTNVCLQQPQQSQPARITAVNFPLILREGNTWIYKGEL